MPSAYISRPSRPVSLIRPIRIQLRYATRLLDHLQASLFSEKSNYPWYSPSMQELAKNFQITWSFQWPLKPMILNARAQLNDNLDIDMLTHQLSTQRCGCTRYPVRYQMPYENFGMHLCTRDLSALDDQELAQLLAKGLNHIPTTSHGLHQAIAQLVDATEQYCRYLIHEGLLSVLAVAEANRDMAAATLMEAATQQAISWAKDTMKNMDLAEQEPSDELSRHISLMLNKLKDRVWLTEVDKAPNDLCLICPSMAQHLIMNRLQGPDFAEALPDRAVLISTLKTPSDQHPTCAVSANH
jgi:hypothetical protein